jgi:hypothetical protein
MFSDLGILAQGPARAHQPEYAVLFEVGLLAPAVAAPAAGRTGPALGIPVEADAPKEGIAPDNPTE